jgi:hypothetical protein
MVKARRPLRVGITTDGGASVKILEFSVRILEMRKRQIEGTSAPKYASNSVLALVRKFGGASRVAEKYAFI